MAADAMPQTISTPRPKRLPHRSAQLPWIAIFCLGLLAGWFVLGRVLLPASPSDAEPPQLSSSYQKIYLRLVAESFWLTQDKSLVQRALAAWDPDAVDLRLSQLEAETSDANVRTHLEALRAALGAPARLYLLRFRLPAFDDPRVGYTALTHIPGAGGVGLAPYVRDLFASMHDGRADEDLLVIPDAIHQARAVPTRPADVAVTKPAVRQMYPPGAAVAQSTAEQQPMDPQDAPADTDSLQSQQNPQAPRAAQQSPAGVLLPEEDDENVTSQGQTSEYNC